MQPVDCKDGEVGRIGTKHASHNDTDVTRTEVGEETNNPFDFPIWILAAARGRCQCSLEGSEL